MKRIDFKTAFGYAFIHFSMEVLCFFFLYRVFAADRIWWGIAVLYDAVAFAGQVPVGALCEKFQKFRPGVCGAVMLTVGAAIGLIAAGNASVRTTAVDIAGDAVANTSVAGAGIATGGFALAAAITGFVILSIGNAFLHISGALVTLRVSEGRLSESGIFVGGGAFGVVTGRLLGSGDGEVWIPFVLMAVSMVLIVAIDRYVRRTFAVKNLVSGIEQNSDRSSNSANEKYRNNSDVFDFDRYPCEHSIAADRPAFAIIFVLAGVVMVRSYISNGIPLQWKKTALETILLFVTMGIGKMAGGVLADLFGARLIGVLSCLLAVPFLIAGGNLMWVSLVGVALFSMTMAIALGGIVSVVKSNPGIAFGITTFALFLGTLPVFFSKMPEGTVMNIILAVLSVLSAGGIYYSLRKGE